MKSKIPDPTMRAFLNQYYWQIHQFHQLPKNESKNCVQLKFHQRASLIQMRQFHMKLINQLYLIIGILHHFYHDMKILMTLLRLLNLFRKMLKMFSFPNTVH